MATSLITLSGRDYSGELTSTQMRLDAVAGDGSDYAAHLTSIGAMQTALNAVSLIDFTGESFLAVKTKASGTPAASADAQRELKWLVRYSDNVDSDFDGNFEIGGADTSLLVANTDLMDLTGGAGAALVTAIEANVVSKAGNAITVVEVVLTGRST